MAYDVPVSYRLMTKQSKVIPGLIIKHYAMKTYEGVEA
jgi:hypothetical protein